MLPVIPEQALDTDGERNTRNRSRSPPDDGDEGRRAPSGCCRPARRAATVAVIAPGPAIKGWRAEGGDVRMCSSRACSASFDSRSCRRLNSIPKEIVNQGAGQPRSGNARQRDADSAQEPLADQGGAGQDRKGDDAAAAGLLPPRRARQAVMRARKVGTSPAGSTTTSRVTNA